MSRVRWGESLQGEREGLLRVGAVVWEQLSAKSLLGGVRCPEEQPSPRGGMASPTVRTAVRKPSCGAGRRAEGCYP